MLNKLVGIIPVKLLDEKSIFSKDAKFPTVLGMLPLKVLYPRYKLLN